LLSVAGFAAGAVTTLSIYLKLNIAYLLLIALPPIVTTFSFQTQQAYLTTFIFLVYLIFLSGISYRLNREYWLTLYNTRSLSKHVKELVSTNEELEAFNYSVSHDLRAPIRAIDGFSQALAEDAGDKLGASELDHVVELSRITRRKTLFKTVNLSQLASSIVENIRLTHPHRHVTVDIQPDMQVLGDERLLGILLDNLIGNAWKYTRRIDHAEIKIGETSVDGQPVFFVNDNGAGFDMQYANKLFVPFQRLHGNQDFPGEGIGLATAYRVIQRHNGRIWGESLLDSYTTFYFTLRAQASFDA
jgi:light-regulated signal transduction histidine kinase (bacteriophytochrome)